MLILLDRSCNIRPFLRFFRACDYRSPFPRENIMSSCVRTRRPWQGALPCVAAFFIVITSMRTAPAWAQTSSLSTIHGTVTDPSGAALPGVTVTLASPALQVGRATSVTEPDGTYRFSDLPVGTYKVTFELQGFKTFVRD
jgi:hypothetical protein